MAEEDYYEILSLEPDATQEQVLDSAKKAIEKWHVRKKRGIVSPQTLARKRNQIRRATAVLADAFQRMEYDLEKGFRKNFSGMTWGRRKSGLILARPSVNREGLPKVKIPGQLDYEKLARSIAKTEDPLLNEIGLKEHPEKSASEAMRLNDGRNDINSPLNELLSKVRTSDQDIDDNRSRSLDIQSEGQEKPDSLEHDTRLKYVEAQARSNILEPKPLMADTRKIASEGDLREGISDLKNLPSDIFKALDSDPKDTSIEKQVMDSENSLDSRIKEFEVKHINSYKILKDKYSRKQRALSQTTNSDVKLFKPSRLPLEEERSKIPKASSLEKTSKEDLYPRSNSHDSKEHREELRSNGIRNGTQSKRFLNAVELLEDIKIFPSTVKVPLGDFHSKNNVIAHERSNEEGTHSEQASMPKSAVSESLERSISKESSKKILGQVQSLIDNFKEWICEAYSIPKLHGNDSEIPHKPVKENRDNTLPDADDLCQGESESGLAEKEDADVKGLFETYSSTADDHEGESVDSDTIGSRKLSKVEKRMTIKDWR